MMEIRDRCWNDVRTTLKARSRPMSARDLVNFHGTTYKLRMIQGVLFEMCVYRWIRKVRIPRPSTYLWGDD